MKSCLLAQSCPTLCDSMDCSLPGSSVHGIFQARGLEYVAISSSGDLPHPGIEPESPALAGRFFTTEPPGKPTVCIKSPRIFITKAHFQVPSKNLGWCQESVFLNNCPQRIFKRKLDGVGCSDLTWLSTGKQCFPSNIRDRGWGVPSYMLIKLLASLRIGQSINYPVCAAVHGVTKSWTQLSNWTTITTTAT